MGILDVRQAAFQNSYIDVLGVVVAIYDKKYMVVDDGAAQILVRNGNEGQGAKMINPGDVARVIGRVSEGSEGKYIIGEIIKKIANPDWIKVRRAELNQLNKGGEVRANAKEQPVERESSNEGRNDPADYILGLVRKLDEGHGAAVDAILKNSAMEECKSIIDMLMNRGDIFEIEPGRVKVLE